jgi:putative glutamine amidotransferase
MDGGSAPGHPSRPLVAIPARFSASASALRYEAEVVARKVAQAVFAAGGEPFVMHPHAPDGVVDDSEVRARLQVADAVLLPGGGDMSAHWYGQPADPTLYDVDVEQDAFDLAVARVALAEGIPLLSICRGTQVVNVARGGTLRQDMADGSHRHHVHQLSVEPGTALWQIVGATTSISCYHHQCVEQLGEGLEVEALSEDGIIEAIQAPRAPGWYLGVQWHPEDTAATDLVQAALFEALVAAAR